MEEKRKFNPRRLYKLAKVIVLVTTSIAAIVTIVLSPNVFNPQRVFRNLHCSYDTPLNERVLDWNDCTTRAGQIVSDSERNFGLSLKVAILTPLIFFVGSWTYKYLFPEKGIDKKIDS